MKLYDFDAKFYEYVQVQMAMQAMPLKDDEIEEKYNQMMESWLNAPAQWLYGVKPVDYFKRYSEPKELIKLLEGYLTRDMGLPEPLYTRIVEIGEPCAPALTRIAGDAGRKESLRATAIALLKDMESTEPVDLFVDMVCHTREENELNEMACEALKAMKIDLTDRLLERYDAAPEYARLMILELCANTPSGFKVFDKLVDGLRRDAVYRGLYAGLLAEIGDERAIEPLREAANYTDLGYLDYLEIRSAIEELGGDPGEARDFNGDPEYEAMRNL